jgi:hypothetical protein
MGLLPRSCISAWCALSPLQSRKKGPPDISSSLSLSHTVLVQSAEVDIVFKLP